MKEKRNKKITIEDLKTIASETIFSNDEVVVIKASKLPEFEDVKDFTFECFTIIVCTQGELDLYINGIKYHLDTERSAFLIPGNSIRKIDDEEKDPNFDAKIIAFAPNLLESVETLKQERWNIGYHLYKNPILSTDKRISYKTYLFRELIFTMINEPQNPFTDESLRHLFISGFCDMLLTISKEIPKDLENAYKVSQADHVFRKFIDAVLYDNGTHRSVAYFAALLCYTPKHLSMVIKQTCNRSPLQIINDHAMRLIKHQLVHSEMSMKEIADMYRFANPSFFGKFVKAHTGKSPQQYRKIYRGE